LLLLGSVSIASGQTPSLRVNGSAPTANNGTVVTVTTGSVITIEINGEAGRPYGLFGALAKSAADPGFFLAQDGATLKDPFPVFTGLMSSDVGTTFGVNISPFRAGSPLIKLDGFGNSTLQFIVSSSLPAPQTFFIQAVEEPSGGGALGATNGIQIDLQPPSEAARLLVSHGATADDVEFGVLQFTLADPANATFTAALSNVDVQEIGLASTQQFHRHDYDSGELVADLPRDIDVFSGRRPSLNPENDAFPRIVLPATGNLPERELLRCYDTVSQRGFFLLIFKDTPNSTGTDYVQLTAQGDSFNPALNPYQPLVGINQDGTRMVVVAQDSGPNPDRVYLFALDGTTPFSGSDRADITPAVATQFLPRAVAFTQNHAFFVVDDGVDADADTFSHQLFTAPLFAAAPSATAVDVPPPGDPLNPGNPVDFIVLRSLMSADNGSVVVFAGGDTAGSESVGATDSIDFVQNGDWYSIADLTPDQALNITQLPALTGNILSARLYEPGRGYHGRSGYASLSPDGSRLAFVANHDDDKRNEEDDEVYTTATDGSDVGNIIGNEITNRDTFDSRGNPALDNAQDVAMVDSDNLLFFYGENDDEHQGDRAMDLFHYQVSTGLVTNLTKIGDPVAPFFNAGDIYPEGYFTSANDRFFYFVRGNAAFFSLGRANLVGVDVQTLDVFNITGNEFLGLPQPPTGNPLGFGENSNWHLVRGGGSFNNLVYFASNVDSVTSAQNVWVFDAEFPFAAFRLTNEFSSQLQVESLTPNPHELGVGFAFGLNTGAADVHYMDLTFQILDDLTESSRSADLPLSSMAFLSRADDQGGAEVVPAMVYAMDLLNSSGGDNPTLADFFFASLDGPEPDFPTSQIVDPLTATTGVLQIYHVSVD
jgi:hypothetical protein